MNPITLAFAAVLVLQTGAAATQAPKQIAVSPQHLATAFRDSGARTLLDRARAARVQLDSAIVSYDAMVHHRLSLGVNVGRFGRERVLYRTEAASRVRWHRDVGARVEAKGARSVHPGPNPEKVNEQRWDDIPDMMTLPYYPGQESLWLGPSIAPPEIERELVHPLAGGGEAYYTYETGDSAALRLPDGTEVRLHELKVRPRTVRWNVVVGSLWFDVERGQLVRAAYRLAEPLDVWAWVADHPADAEAVPRAVRAIVSPVRAQISAMAVEYGLHQERFWLPRLRSVEGHAQASVVRISFSGEQRYRYSAVNVDSLAAIELPPPDSVKPRRGSPCDTGSTHYTTVRTDTRRQIPIAVTVPCDHRALASSPELPGSIYAADEEPFDEATREMLFAEALALGAQPGWGPRPPTIEYGLPLARFNRVEGLSLGARATQRLGAGYVADATLRAGFADRRPNLELGLARTNLSRTVRVAGYNRLVAANDWGDPLSLGSSLSALLWGRDDGFYYRASGMDMSGTSERGTHVTWRLFAEHERPAAVENTFSLAKLARDVAFQANVVAARGLWAGASLRAVRTLGLDPRDWRVLSDLRLEAAGGTAPYGRAAFDVTLSRALGPAISAAPLAAVTLSTGSSVGDVPPQRLWFLGGTHTIRGQSPGTARGDAYWFGRLELAQDGLGFGRLSLFGDAGWAGPRGAFASEPCVLAGAGVGYGVLDGLLRLDVAKGIRPAARWRTDLYLEARF